MIDYHSRFLAVIDEIETTFPVADWLLGDVPVWPLARADLYIDMYWQNAGRMEDQRRITRQKGVSSRIVQAAAYAATPLINLWRSRADLRHMVLRPQRAHALFLGHAGSLDQIDGAWRDRFCDPLLARWRATVIRPF